MADDIVKELRRVVCWHAGDFDGACHACQAAAEIERLRAEIQKVRLDHITTLGELQEAAVEIERLRAAILEWDASVDCFYDDMDSYQAATARYKAARAAAVNEARRG